MYRQISSFPMITYIHNQTEIRHNVKIQNNFYYEVSHQNIGLSLVAVSKIISQRSYSVLFEQTTHYKFIGSGIYHKIAWTIIGSQLKRPNNDAISFRRFLTLVLWVMSVHFEDPSFVGYLSKYFFNRSFIVLCCICHNGADFSVLWEVFLASSN